jgi:hypothetical protein
VESYAEALRDFENCWHVGGRREGAYFFEVILKAGGGDEDTELAGCSAGVAIGMDYVARSEDRFALRYWMPFAVRKYLEVAFEDDEGLVLFAVAVRWRTSARRWWR